MTQSSNGNRLRRPRDAYRTERDEGHETSCRLRFERWTKPSASAGEVRGSYSRAAWLPVIGPTAWLIWGAIVDGLDPDGRFTRSLEDLGRPLGLRPRGRVLGAPSARALWPRASHGRRPLADGHDLPAVARMPAADRAKTCPGTPSHSAPFPLGDLPPRPVGERRPHLRRRPSASAHPPRTGRTTRTLVGANEARGGCVGARWASLKAPRSRLES